MRCENLEFSTWEANACQSSLGQHFCPNTSHVRSTFPAYPHHTPHRWRWTLYPLHTARSNPTAPPPNTRHHRLSPTRFSPELHLLLLPVREPPLHLRQRARGGNAARWSRRSDDERLLLPLLADNRARFHPFPRCWYRVWDLTCGGGTRVSVLDVEFGI